MLRFIYSILTFEVNDTNSRPSTSSSSGCIATVNDGLWTTVGEAAAAFHSLPLELPQRLLIFLFLLRYWGDDLGVDAEEEGVLEVALGNFHTSKTGCFSGVTQLALVSFVSTRGRFWTSTSSPSACLPLIQGTYCSPVLAGLDIIGFNTGLVSCALDKEAASLFVL